MAEHDCTTALLMAWWMLWLRHLMGSTSQHRHPPPHPPQHTHSPAHPHSYTLGGLYLARYEDSPVGAFEELVTLAGLVWNPPTSCAWAARVYVNNRWARASAVGGGACLSKSS